MSETEAHRIEIIDSLNAVDAAEWDACVEPDTPFARHGFLSALEDSKSVDAQAGWHPQHMVLRGEDGKIRAAAPLYLKGHSYGEYVFDWSWADAYARTGGQYYPKLQSAIPFTPATGRRFLLGPGSTLEDIDILASAMVQRAKAIGSSSVHVTFPTRAEWEHLGGIGFLKRRGVQYHWDNDGYQTFEDFLAQLSSRKRKAIRKERKKVAETDLVIKTLTGTDIEDRHWDAFFRFYLDTGQRKWGQPYLQERFFPMIGERLGDAVVLVMAFDGDRPIAGALNIAGSETLFGRHWGCSADYKFLHFELCYYRAIDHAIERGLKRVEAGAQGEHKIQRGYTASETFSAHWIFDDRFKAAVQNFLDQENQMVAHEMAAIDSMSPFKKDG